jgi:hypothetical protein
MQRYLSTKEKYLLEMSRLTCNIAFLAVHPQLIRTLGLNSNS